MSIHESKAIEGTDSVKPRLYRALTEYHTVINEGGDIYSVTSQSGREYMIDAREERCTCPDHQYRKKMCKHILRVALVRGERVIPAAIDRDEVDPLLGLTVETTPVAVAADGDSVQATDGNDHETQVSERPDDCDCWNPDGDLPCWPCYRDGFEAPNPCAEE